MKVFLKVMPRPEALDPQGRAVEGLLKRMGHQLDSCRIGKLIELEVPEKGSPDETRAEAEKMARELLYNPLIETCEVLKN